MVEFFNIKNTSLLNNGIYKLSSFFPYSIGIPDQVTNLIINYTLNLYNYFVYDISSGPVTFSAINLPPGLVLNSVTGEVTGIATTIGDYVVDITLIDGNGNIVNDSFNFKVVNTLPNIYTALGSPFSFGNFTYNVTVNTIMFIEVWGNGGSGGPGGGGAVSATMPPSYNAENGTSSLFPYGNYNWTDGGYISVFLNENRIIYLEGSKRGGIGGGAIASTPGINGIPGIGGETSNYYIGGPFNIITSSTIKNGDYVSDFNYTPPSMYDSASYGYGGTPGQGGLSNGTTNRGGNGGFGGAGLYLHMPGIHVSIGDVIRIEIDVCGKPLTNAQYWTRPGLSAWRSGEPGRGPNTSNQVSGAVRLIYF